MNSKQAAETTPLPYHYYASTAFDWAVADTREAAIAMVARHAGADTIKRNVKNNGGLYVWSCRVDCPQATTYTISNYAPAFLTLHDETTNVRVPTARVVCGRIQNTKGHITYIEPEDI